jgi:cysteine desulfurase
VGKIPVDVQKLGVDLFSVAGQKVYAPKGVGALYVRAPLDPEKFCWGAGQEDGRRAGTENVMGIVGLGKACEIAQKGLDENMVRMKYLRERLHEGLMSRLVDIRLNGSQAERLPNTASISFKGLEANRILEEIGPEVAASAGAACHADTVELSHVLIAMGVPLEWAKGTLRFSVGKMTTEAEIDKTIRVVANVVEKLRGIC